jgi:hypothetical protein
MDILITLQSFSTLVTALIVRKKSSNRKFHSKSLGFYEIQGFKLKQLLKGKKLINVLASAETHGLEPEHWCFGVWLPFQLDPCCIRGNRL